MSWPNNQWYEALFPYIFLGCGDPKKWILIPLDNIHYEISDCLILHHCHILECEFHDENSFNIRTKVR